MAFQYAMWFMYVMRNVKYKSDEMKCIWKLKWYTTRSYVSNPSCNTPPPLRRARSKSSINSRHLHSRLPSVTPPTPPFAYANPGTSYWPKAQVASSINGSSSGEYTCLNHGSPTTTDQRVPQCHQDVSSSPSQGNAQPPTPRRPWQQPQEEATTQNYIVPMSRHARRDGRVWGYYCSSSPTYNPCQAVQVPPSSTTKESL